jgi:flagellar hook assembly protein FlgD
MDLGERSEGNTRIQWDGKSDAGQVQPAGTYVVEVKAETEDGALGFEAYGVDVGDVVARDA